MARNNRSSLLKDSITARINPLEAMVLKSIGGSGKLDPRTGMVHFAMDSASSRGMSRGGNGAIGRDQTGGSNRSEGGGAGSTAGGLVGGLLGGGIGSALGGPLGGFAGVALGQRAGTALGNADMRGGAAPSTGRGGEGGGGGLGGRGGGVALTPAAGTLPTPKSLFQRPAAATAPAWMHFDPVMTALQKRSYIATQGVSGNQGLYRSQEAKDYYKNLLGQDFISPTGGLQGDLTGLLPIEQQYLGALGVPQFKDVHGLLKGLGY